jgi:hypothetical protein
MVDWSMGLGMAVLSSCLMQVKLVLYVALVFSLVDNNDVQFVIMLHACLV